MKNKCIETAKRGLDFFVNKQIVNSDSADCGRFPYVYNCKKGQIEALSPNWTTSILIEALLVGYNYFKEPKYLESAGKAVNYLKSLQRFSPFSPECYGVFQEVTPQSDMAYPRDALTSAWAMLDYALLTDNSELVERSKMYANWFCQYGMADGYPHWTVRFDNEPAFERNWCGSFHSGSAFFMQKMYKLTGEVKYKNAMKYILRYYNEHHLDADGVITVMLDRNTFENLDDNDGEGTPPKGWRIMHRYNDDFGALANLAAYNETGDVNYKDAFERFIGKMVRSQHNDGGFGPQQWTVPSAAGVIAVEIMAAKTLGIIGNELDGTLDASIDYIVNLQVRDNEDSCGAFRGFTDDYVISSEAANGRTGAYSIMALLRYAGAEDNIYFFNKSCEGKLLSKV